MKRFVIGFTLLWAGFLVPNQASAADARDYIAAPPGTTLFLTYMKSLTANELYNDGNKIGSDFNLDVKVGVFRLVHFTEIFGITVDPQLVMPFSAAHLDGATVGGNSFSATGMGDPTILATFWAINNGESKTWLGITPYLTIPIGDYDEGRALNPGANRWTNKWELGFVQGLGKKTFFDLAGNVEFFGDNKDFAGDKLKQDPAFGIESHLSYDISNKFYVAADYVYAYGAETRVGGVDQMDKKDNHTLGASFAFGIGDNYQLMLQYKKDIEVKSGPKMHDFTARFLYVF